MSCNAKKDPNGTWRIQYRWTDWTGAKKKSQKRGFKTKKEAEEWYAHFFLSCPANQMHQLHADQMRLILALCVEYQQIACTNIGKLFDRHKD